MFKCLEKGFKMDNTVPKMPTCNTFSIVYHLEASEYNQLPFHGSHVKIDQELALGMGYEQSHPKFWHDHDILTASHQVTQQ